MSFDKEAITSPKVPENLAVFRRCIVVAIAGTGIFLSQSSNAYANDTELPVITSGLPGSLDAPAQPQEVEIALQADDNSTAPATEAPGEGELTGGLPGSVIETSGPVPSENQGGASENNTDQPDTETPPDESNQEPSSDTPVITGGLPGSAVPRDTPENTDPDDANLPLPTRPEESEDSAGSEEPSTSSEPPTPPSNSDRETGTYYNQHDPEWASYEFHGGAGGNMDRNGCGPTTLAMVISRLTGQEVTPIEIADRLMALGPRGVTPNGSTVHEGIAIVAEQYGLQVEFFTNPDVLSDVERSIDNGGYVITNGRDSDPSTPATSGGHILAIEDVTPEGMIDMLDSNSREMSDRLFTPEQIFGPSTMAIEILPAPVSDTSENESPLTPEGFEAVADPDAERDDVYNTHSHYLNNIQIDMLPVHQASLDKFIRHYQENRDRYMAISEQTDLPAPLIAAIHWRESTGNFSTYLHNGDPLGAPTVNVPEDIYFDNFEDAAIDALDAKASLREMYSLSSDSQDLAAMASYAEYYNGLGYHNKEVPSPYVYSGTNIYESGKYVADGVYDPSEVDQQLGVLLMIAAVRNI